MAVERSPGRDGHPAWREWSRARLEREYSPSSMIASSAPFIDAWIQESRRAYDSLEVRRDLRYGDCDDETVDLFPAVTFAAVAGSPAREGGPTPLVVFLHGGYWQELGKTDSVFAAPGLVADGIAFAAVDYSLAPRATVAAIVDQAIRATRWLRTNAPSLGVDPARIVVAGHSAGAQLAAMALLADARERSNGGSPGGSSDGAAPAFAGGLLISGVYELEPLVGTYINDALDLDVDEARALSPQVSLERAGQMSLAPVGVTWGEIEPPEFARQSETFAATWAGHGGVAHAFEVAGRNHFDIVSDMGHGSTRVGATLRRLCGIGGS